MKNLTVSEKSFNEIIAKKYEDDIWESLLEHEFSAIYAILYKYYGLQQNFVFLKNFK